MRIGIYSPYLDSFGGGERYMLTIAEALSSKENVDLLFDTHLSSLNSNNLKGELEKRFNLDLSKVNIKNAPLGVGSNFLERLLFFKQYDLIIALTDGSIFYSTAKKSFLHIQSPLSVGIGSGLWRMIKLRSWDLILYNSQFTKLNAQKRWPLKSIVITPPVDVESIKPGIKGKKILSVGRFSGYLKDKKQDLLIDAFERLVKEADLKGWSLNLAGSASDGDANYINELKNQAKGLSVNFYPNISYGDLNKLYAESTIYWHASGFGESDPSKMEHFGITTVEAMAGGCVPLVIGLGGQKDIVEDGKTGLLWNTLDELFEKTLTLIKDRKLSTQLSKNAVLRSRDFNKEKFIKEIRSLVYGN